MDAYKIRINDSIKTFTKLERLDLDVLGGKEMPIAIHELQYLKYMRFRWKVGEKVNHLDLLKLLEGAQTLKEVVFHFALKFDIIGDEIIRLDHLKTINAENFPTDINLLSLGLLKKASYTVRGSQDRRIKGFQSLVKPYDFTDFQRKVIFAVYWERLDLINELLTEPLESLLETTGKTIYLSSRPSSDLNQKIKTYLKNVTLKINKNFSEEDLLIVNSKTPIELVIEALSQGQVIATEDHLKELLTALEAPWLKEEENESSIHHIQQLIVTNQSENILLALQIISGGGATTEILTMLVALMMAHPDKKVAKESEKIFKKLGSSAAYDIIKKSKIYLRRSGNSIKKVNHLFRLDFGIDEMIFRILHALIAGENSTIMDLRQDELLIQGSYNCKIPDLIRECHQFTKISLQKSSGIHINASFESLGSLDHLKSLDLSGCNYEIGPEVSKLTNLSSLNLTSNQLLNAAALQTLKNLTWLSLEGCQITDWGFINHLPNLTHLNISRNKLKEIPEPILKHEKLQELILKQNKVKEISEGLVNSAFKVIDLSNNLIQELNYKVFDIKGLEKLFLRSNKIQSFDPNLVKPQTDRPLKVLNLGSNALDKFELLSTTFPGLWELDLSKNNLTELHDSIFISTAISSLYAFNNKISSIPKSISNRRFNYLALQNNLITELHDFIEDLEVQNFDLRNNQIAYIHPSVVDRSDSYSKLYWKLNGNPIRSIPYG